MNFFRTSQRTPLKLLYTAYAAFILRTSCKISLVLFTHASRIRTSTFSNPSSDKKGSMSLVLHVFPISQSVKNIPAQSNFFAL